METARAFEPLAYPIEEQADTTPLTSLDLEMIAGGAGVLNYD